MIHLLLGGAASGQDHYAMTLVRELLAKGWDACYVTTAANTSAAVSPYIGEPSQHIDASLFSDTLQLSADPALGLAALLTRLSQDSRVILVDNLSLWLRNQLADALKHDMDDEPADTESNFALDFATSRRGAFESHTSLNSAHLAQWQKAKASLLSTLGELAGDVIVMSHELGSHDQGLAGNRVAVDDAEQMFITELGALNQAVAAIADRVTLVVAGLPLTVKT